MRLSEWRAATPAREAAVPKVAAVVDPVLVALGADPDPHCWVAWGEEPANRFTVFIPTEPGLIVCFVRVNVPGEGPRATTKLVRWGKVTIGELSVETQAGHRMLSFQLESQVLRGVDAESDRAAAFALRVIAAIDGRPLPSIAESRAGRTRAGRAGGTRTGATKAAGATEAAGATKAAGSSKSAAARTTVAAPAAPGVTPSQKASSYAKR